MDRVCSRVLRHKLALTAKVARMTSILTTHLNAEVMRIYLNKRRGKFKTKKKKRQHVH